MITRRTISQLGLWVLCISVPIAYSDGRNFEGRRLNPADYPVEQSFLNSLPIVYIRTLVGGEPDILRSIAGAGLLLTGICAISLAFDCAPKKTGVTNTVLLSKTENEQEQIGEVSSSDVETATDSEAFSEKNHE